METAPPHLISGWMTRPPAPTPLSEVLDPPLCYTLYTHVEKMERIIPRSGAPNEHFSESEPLTTENENLDAFKAFSSTFLCCWKEFICSSLPAG